MYAEMTTVTPDTARTWLTRNRVNRRLNPQTVSRYAGDMSFERWSANPQPIILGTGGELLDGQHRLHAIVQLGEPRTMLVVFDTPPEVQRDIDTGRKRSIADGLTLSGTKNGTILVAAARLGLMWDSGTKHTNRLSDSAVREYIDENLEALAHATSQGKHYETSIRWIPCSVMAAMHYQSRHSSPDRVDAWWSGIANHSLDGDGDPRVALYRRFSDPSIKAVTTYAKLGGVARMWNASVKGDHVQRLQLASRNGELVALPKLEVWND